MSQGHIGMEAFRRTVTDIETVLASLQRRGADERVNALVESLIGQLKSGDSLLMPVLNVRRTSWSPAQTAVIISIVGLRIGIELDFTHPELSLLGQAALVYEFVAGAASVRPGGEDGLRIIRALGAAFSTAGDLVFQAREQVNGNGNGGGGSGTRLQQATEIVAVAASYAYLARELPAGRPTWPPLAVKEFLRRGRARFSDAVLKALIHISVQLPVGAYVRLNSGEVAHVVATNAGHPLRPVVVIAGRRAKHPDEPQRVDLRENPLLSVLEFLGHEPPAPETENRQT